MTGEELKNLGIDIDTEDNTVVIMANTALEWIAENTTINTEDIENIPYRAKLFISKYCELNSLPSGVTSESIEGLSQSFTSGALANSIWDLANGIFSTSDLKSRVRFVTAQKRFV